MGLERLRILALQPAVQAIPCLTPDSSDLGFTLLLFHASTHVCDTNQWYAEQLSLPRLREHFRGSSCSRQSLQMHLWGRLRKCGPSGSTRETSRWSSTRIQSRGHRPRRHPLRALLDSYCLPWERILHRRFRWDPGYRCDTRPHSCERVPVSPPPAHSTCATRHPSTCFFAGQHAICVPLVSVVVRGNPQVLPSLLPSTARGIRLRCRCLVSTQRDSTATRQARHGRERGRSARRVRGRSGRSVRRSNGSAVRGVQRA